MFTAHLTGVSPALDRLEGLLDDVLETAVRDTAQVTAEAAKDHHSFHNRTGDLEGSIQALDPSGRASAGTLVGHVVALEDYAEYVDARLPFLAPAWEASEARAGRLADDALERASARW